MYIILTIVLVLFLANLAAGYYMYRFAVVRDHSGKRQRNLWEEELEPNRHMTEAQNAMMKEGADYIKSHVSELVRIKSHDGLTLVGHIVEAEPDKTGRRIGPRGVFIMVHGYRSHAVYDFSCAVKTVCEMGFDCLLIDMRAHGYSEGEKIGFGALEKYDLARWAAFADDRWGLPIVLDGISMGAATVMMGAEVGYPPSVRAIIADCGYTNAGEICKRTLRRWFNLPPFPIYYTAKVFVKLLAGYDLGKTDSESGLNEIKKRRIPILIAHGNADGFVPYSMGEQNMSILGGDSGAELFTADGADHGMAFIVERDGYIDAIHRLFRRAGLE